MVSKDHYLPLNLLGIREVGGRNIVEIKVGLINKPGAIAEVSRVLESMGVNILDGVHSAETYTGTWIFYIDKPEHITLDEIKLRISRLRSVTGIEIRSRRLGEIILDGFHYPIVQGGSKVIVIPIEHFVKVMDSMIRDFKTGGKYILFLMGLSFGESIGEYVSSKCKSIDKSKSVELALEFLRIYGLGVPRVYNISSGTFRVELSECFEAEVERPKEVSECYFMRGTITGIMRKILDNENLIAVEENCRIRGDRRCVFSIREAKEDVPLIL